MHIISILERTLKNGFDNPKAPIEKGFKEGYENALIILQRNDLETAQRKIYALIKTLEDDARYDFGKGRMLALFETSLMIGAVLKGDDADDIEGGYVATTGEKHYCEDDSETYFDYSPDDYDGACLSKECAEMDCPNEDWYLAYEIKMKGKVIATLPLE